MRKPTLIRADVSVRGRPEQWGKRAIDAFHEFKADYITPRILDGLSNDVINVGLVFSRRTTWYSLGNELWSESLHDRRVVGDVGARWGVFSGALAARQHHAHKEGERGPVVHV